MKDFNLTNKQKELIENHLSVVKWTIIKNIHTNNNIQGMDYDDLFQVGCLALCKAVVRYNGQYKFETFAQVVVKNALIDHCRKVNRLQSKLVYMDSPINEDKSSSYAEILKDDFKFENELIDNDIYKELREIKKDYNGVILKGIEAIELKLRGYSGSEIADIYKVKSNNVSAWISRASKKLREDRRFLLLLKAS